MNGHNQFDDAMAQPALQPRPLKAIVIGAGASGLIMAYKLQRNFIDVDLIVYEKNTGVAGTWFENRYPGCACDNYSHSYTYSFEPKTDWSRSFALAPEIKQYFTDFATKYDLNKYIRLSSQVVSCSWDETLCKWKVQVKVEDDKTIYDEADILVNAGDVPGLNTFEGTLIHTAAWDESVDLTDKRVGLVGNGSSAVQILPTILPEVKSITNFIRSPTWITTPFGVGAPREFTAEEKEKFRKDPKFHLAMRKELENFSNRLYPIWKKGSPEQTQAAETFRTQMTEQLGNEKLSKFIIPEFGLGCRRLTPGVGYCEALGDSKVEVVLEAMSEVTPRGAKSKSGKSFDFDVLICATGFDTSFKPRYPMLGLGGRDLRDLWADEPRGYLGLAVPNFPNYFTFLGPNCPISNGPVISAIESQADYICKFLNRIQTEGIRSVVPKLEAVDEFMKHKDRFFKTTVFDDKCSTWYKQGDKVTAVWVGSTVHYLRAIENPRYEDWDFTWKTDNRWSYLGNGFGPDDADREADLSWYIRTEDTSPIIGTKRMVKNQKEGPQYGVIGSYEYQFLDS